MDCLRSTLISPLLLIVLLKLLGASKMLSGINNRTHTHMHFARADLIVHSSICILSLAHLHAGRFFSQPRMSMRHGDVC